MLDLSAQANLLGKLRGKRPGLSCKVKEFFED